MTDREKAIVSAYTGYAMLVHEKLSVFYEYVEEKLGRPIMTHHLAMKEVWDELHEKSKSDFISLCADEEKRNKKMGEIEVPIVVNIDMDTIIDNLKKEGWLPVVRCKSCKFNWKNGGDCVSDPEWFCADGKRKTDDK